MQKWATSPRRAQQGGRTASTEAGVCGDLGAVWRARGRDRSVVGWGEVRGWLEWPRKMGERRALGNLKASAPEAPESSWGWGGPGPG